MNPLLLVLALVSPAGSDSVYGVVHNGITGSPVAGVRVETGSEGPTAFSTASGGYSLTTLASGLQSLTFSRAGYDGFVVKVVIPAGSSLHVDVELQPVPQSLPRLEVAGGQPRRRAAGVSSPNANPPDIGLRLFQRGELRSDPLAPSDDPLMAAATSIDPAADPGLPGAMHVHGGSGDQNLLLLDGLPIYGGTHPGGAAGLLNPDAVSDVAVHAAVPPASLGGRLSSAVEVHLVPTAEGSVRFTGAWDAQAVRQLVQGSFSRGAGSFLISGRQSYRGGFAQDGDGWLSNGFHDFLARGSFASQGNEIRVYLLTSGDRLGFPAMADLSQQNNSGVPTGPRNQFSSSSSTVGAVWTRSRSAGSTLTTRLWSASSHAAVDWSPAPVLVKVGSDLNEIGISSELLVGHSGSSQRLGLSFQRTASAYDVGSTAVRARFHSAPSTVSAFVEDRRTVGRWSTVLGFRGTSVDANNLVVEPRLSVRYRASAGVTVSMGAARLHQYVQSMRNEESLLDHAFAAELPLSLDAIGLGAARSDQVTAELEGRIGSGLTLTLGGYARRFQGLLVPAAITTAPFAPGLPPLAAGNAEGLELRARYRQPSFEARANLGVAFTERDVGAGEFLPSSLRNGWGQGGVARRFGERTWVRLAATLSGGAPTSVLRSGVEWQS
ncbi:MAG TPA: TonB-dependent receptor, partial [Gemmatimonadales bacterium]